MRKRFGRCALEQDGLVCVMVVRYIRLPANPFAALRIAAPEIKR
jgi:hypothetical protein